MYETKKDVNGTTTNNRVGHYDTQEQLMVQNSIELRVPVHNPADHNPQIKYTDYTQRETICLHNR